MTFGMIVGNRGFFPDQLAEEGRAQAVALGGILPELRHLAAEKSLP
jgi:L-fucose isomerase-like protein